MSGSQNGTILLQSTTLNTALSCKPKKWKIMNDDMCPLCHVKHDIVHLLFLCVKAQSTWEYVNLKLNTNLSLFDIICGCNNNVDFNFFISLVSFLIYKECLMTKHENWASNNILDFINYNIKIYLETYKNLRKSQLTL